MGAFLGPLGGLVEFVHWREKQHRTTVRPANLKTTLGGSRKAFLGARPLREWAMTATDMSPQRFAPFESLLAWSPGPFVFVDQMAQVTNVLTPRASVFSSGVTGGSVSGAFTGEDGSVHRASLVASSGNVYFGEDAPVVPGRPVTGAVYASSGTKVHLHIRDAAGAVLTNISTTAARPGERVALSTVAPAAAVSARLVVAAGTGPGTVAGPTITWTSAMLPYGMGRGCGKAIVVGHDDAFTWADPDPQGQRLADFSFTVTEVGDGA